MTSWRWRNWRSKPGTKESTLKTKRDKIEKDKRELQQAKDDLADLETEVADAESDVSGGGSGSDNPFVKIFEGIGDLADMGFKGVKETFLPPGFSDPQDWGITKVLGGLLGFGGGLATIAEHKAAKDEGRPPNPILGNIPMGAGSAVSGGSPSSLLQALVPPIGKNQAGEVVVGSPGQSQESFQALLDADQGVPHGPDTGANAPAPAAPGVGTGPPPGPTTVVDASIHMGDVNKGDGAQVVQKASNQQAANTRPNFGTRRV